MCVGMVGRHWHHPRMTYLDRIALDAPAASEKGPKPAQISRKVKTALRLMQAGKAKTITAAAEQAGLTRPYLSRSIRKQAVQSWIATQVRSSLIVGLLRSGDRVVELVDAQSEHVSLDASRHIQALAGLRPAERGGPVININNNIAPGYVIDLSGSAPPMLEHETAGETGGVLGDDHSSLG
jgi:hypothetical protein